jgi:hypothetical protein
VTARRALVKISVLNEAMLFMTAFGTHKTFRPLDLEKMFPAIIFCLEYFTERFEANLFLLHLLSPLC